MMTPGLEAELIARRAVVAAHQARCPTCGAPLIASTPAQDAPKDVSGDRGVVPTMPQPGANVVDEDTPSGYMSRPKLI
jgi:hypothetical protein